MDQPGLDGRHRNRDGEVSRKHGNTKIHTLRKIYGASFAQGCDDCDTLADVLHKLDEPSLTKLVHDHEHGHSERNITESGGPAAAA